MNNEEGRAVIKSEGVCYNSDVCYINKVCYIKRDLDNEGGRSWEMRVFVIIDLVVTCLNATLINNKEGRS